MSELNKGMTAKPAAMRRAAASVAEALCVGHRAALDQHVNTLVQDCIQLLDDEDESVVAAAVGALEAVFTKAVRKDDLPQFADWLRGCINNTMSRSRQSMLRGLALPKTIGPIMSVYHQALLIGTPEARESAALAIGELARFTTAEALKPHVVPITGPLIRVFGDRAVWKLKAAILQTLGVLLERAPAAIRAFVPQLQPTFLKALVDVTSLVRLRFFLVRCCLGLISIVVV
jgi:hypothetical protein